MGTPDILQSDLKPQSSLVRASNSLVLKKCLRSFSSTRQVPSSGASFSGCLVELNFSITQLRTAA